MDDCVNMFVFVVWVSNYGTYEDSRMLQAWPPRCFTNYGAALMEAEEMENRFPGIVCNVRRAGVHAFSGDVECELGCHMFSENEGDHRQRQLQKHRSLKRWLDKRLKRELDELE